MKYYFVTTMILFQAYLSLFFLEPTGRVYLHGFSLSFCSFCRTKVCFCHRHRSGEIRRRLKYKLGIKLNKINHQNKSEERKLGNKVEIKEEI